MKLAGALENQKRSTKADWNCPSTGTATIGTLFRKGLESSFDKGSERFFDPSQFFDSIDCRGAHFSQTFTPVKTNPQ
jgi:hypothetical protein